jgi:heptosyltransferase-2
MNKVLFIQTAFIGDVILATSIIEKWQASHPNSRIDVLVRKGNESLLENNPHIEKLYIWDKKSGKYKNLFKIIKEVRKERYDLVVNFQRFMASGLVTAFSKGRDKRGFDKNPLAFTFSKKIKHEIGNGQHEVERNMSLISDLIDDKIVRPKLYPSKEDQTKIETYTKSKFVTMAPTSVWFTKQMPFEKWVELINLVPEDYTIYLLGAPADKSFCEDLIAKSNHKTIQNLCGELSLVQSAALMEKAEMNYMNDSAPLHLASSMNAKTTAFFCSTVPKFGFGPLADRAQILEVEEKLDCRPCGLHGHKECPKSHFKCGYDIKLKTNLGT